MVYKHYTLIIRTGYLLNFVEQVGWWSNARLSIKLLMIVISLIEIVLGSVYKVKQLLPKVVGGWVSTVWSIHYRIYFRVLESTSSYQYNLDVFETRVNRHAPSSTASSLNIRSGCG